MATMKQWSMFLSVAVAGSVARAEPPAGDLTLTLAPPSVTVVESVIEGSRVELSAEAKTAPVPKRHNAPIEAVSQPARISRSVLETPRINAVAVPAPAISNGTRPKAILVSQGAVKSGSDNEEVSTAVGQAIGVPEMIRQRFPNGKPHIERWVAENAKGNIVNHGTYIEYDAQGAVVMSGSYVQGKREGEWTQQISAEQMQGLLGQRDKEFVAPFNSRANFKDGVLDGNWTVVDSKGRLLSTWAYTDGVREGTSSLFNIQGEVTQSVTYKKDLVDGPARIADAGASSKDITFTEGLMLQQVDKWHPLVVGKARVLQSQVWQLVPAPLNVTSSDWANSSMAYRTADGIEPIRHGLSVTFYSNGQRESEGNYERGRRIGTFAWWYANGQQKTVGEYDEDKEDGEWTWWHENGMKQASGYYADGRKIQEWSLWNQEGKLVNRATPSGASQVAGRDASEAAQNR